MIAQFGPTSLRYPNGTPAADEEVLVVQRDTDTPVVLYLDTGGAVVSNPVLTDTLGNLMFFVEEGHYDLIVNDGRISITVDEQELPPGGSHMHHQTSPAATWTIVHSLNTKPSVVIVLDDDPTEFVYTDVSYPDNLTAVLEFPSPVTGYAYM